MSRIPLFGIGQAAKSPYVTAKQLTNLYAEQRPMGEKSIMVAYGTPGLTLFTDSGATPPRGGLEFPQNSVAYFVHRGVLWEVNNAGAMTSRGMLLTTTGRVSMSHNGVQVMIVDGTAGYIYNTVTTVFAQITDGDFPANPVTVGYLGRRFLVNFLGSSRFYWSDVDDGTSWDALNFTNAETNPDAIVAIFTTNGQAVLLGSETTEFFGNSGVVDTAFTSLQGTATEWGLAATWSIAKYDNSFACLMKNRMGQVMIAQISGYLPKKLSTVDVDSIISTYANVADATAYSYMLGGHPMYVISFPSAGATWLFDGSTGIWSKLKSHGISRHLGEFSFNLVNSTIVSDYATGRLYRLDAAALSDNGADIEREIIGETIATQDDEFIEANCLRVDMETGTTLTIDPPRWNPQISLSLSRDNGKTYGPEMWKPMGRTGEFRTRVEWRRLGTQRYLTPKLRWTLQVRTVVVSASLNPEN